MGARYPNPQGNLTLDIVCIDLDGTLAADVWPLAGIGKPLPAAADMLRYYWSKGWAIVIFTARPESHESRIWSWLRKNDFEKYVYNVVCGKPPAALYIDDKSWNPVEEGTWDTTRVSRTT